MATYYNEFDPFAAAWLRELIADRVIPAGEVDERSIVDVRPDDLRGFKQCHFFAGIGGWAYALRLAGWPDDRPVWTGSCPCQPFSAAGKGEGFEDSRHLWPAWFRLIRECRPARLFGEQVASSDGLAWFDTVSTDLEEEGYAVGAADLCAAGVGAPHIRQRLYFTGRMADSHEAGRILERPAHDDNWRYAPRYDVDGRGADDGMADSGSARTGRHSGATDGQIRPLTRAGNSDREHEADRPFARGADGGMEHATSNRRSEGRAESERGSVAGGCGDERLADSHGRRREQCDSGERSVSELDHSAIARPHDTREHGSGSPLLAARPEQPGSLGDHWRDIIWLPCTDGKYRPTKPGIFPLASRVPGRVGILRGAGNAIVPELAAAFIEACEQID